MLLGRAVVGVVRRSEVGIYFRRWCVVVAASTTILKLGPVPLGFLPPFVMFVGGVVAPSATFRVLTPMLRFVAPFSFLWGACLWRGPINWSSLPIMGFLAFGDRKSDIIVRRDRRRRWSVGRGLEDCSFLGSRIPLAFVFEALVKLFSFLQNELPILKFG